MKQYCYIFAITVLISHLAHAGGTFIGDAGGHEKDGTLHARGEGLIRHSITGGGGVYTFRDIPPGEYMAASSGHICPRVRIEEGKTAHVEWTGQPGFGADGEVWTPEHLEFGQTFVATGNCITSVSLWNPGPAANLEVTFHKDGPGGELIYRHAWPEPQGWIFGANFKNGEIPVEAGKTYYVRFASLDGKRWVIGVPGLGDVYDKGMAWFDGIPQPYTDLGVGVGMPASGRVIQAHVALGEGLGYVSEGPASGLFKSGGQTFIATAANVLTLYTNAGFGGAPIPGDFKFAIYEEGPGGKPAGPEVKVRILSNWGGTAVYFPDEIPLTPGKTYYFKYWREDGESFYVYLAKDRYAGGMAFREDQPMPDYDLTFTIEGETTPDGITYPYNVAVASIGTTSAVIEWETGNPSTEQVLYGAYGKESRATEINHEKALHHRVELNNLEPSTVYWYEVVTGTEKPGAPYMHGKRADFMTPVEGEDRPRFMERRSIAPERLPDEVPLMNAGFEKGATGWVSLFNHGARVKTVDGIRPHSGEWMWGWSMVYTGGKDQPHIVQIDRHEILKQRVKVEKGSLYEYSAWICTGDRGSGWGRDSRARLVYDAAGGTTLDATRTINPDWSTQPFATRSGWRRAAVRIQAESDEIVIGLHFWQWWALDADYLFVDDMRLTKVK